MDCCVNTVDEKVLMEKNLANLVKGRCNSNQFCGVKQRQVDMKRLYFLCWHFTTVEETAKSIHRPRMYPLHLIKIS